MEGAHIRLTTKEALPPTLIRAWFRAVRDLAPDGTLITHSMVDDKGQPRSVALVNQHLADGRHAYLVPLARNLTEREAAKIVNAFAEAHDDLDFDIETSETRIALPDRTSITLDDERHLAIATAIAKKRHEDWLRERTDAGWRYGTEFSEEQKTHPLLRPWDQLPDRYRQPDMDAPQVLVNLLRDNGFVLVDQSDLDRISQFMRSLTS